MRALSIAIVVMISSVSLAQDPLNRIADALEDANTDRTIERARESSRRATEDIERMQRQYQAQIMQMNTLQMQAEMLRMHQHIVALEKERAGLLAAAAKGDTNWVQGWLDKASQLAKKKFTWTVQVKKP